jgi:hypothetical protein
MVVDGGVTLIGSYNWTRGAAANSEISSSTPRRAVAAPTQGFRDRTRADQKTRDIQQVALSYRWQYSDQL